MKRITAGELRTVDLTTSMPVKLTLDGEDGPLEFECLTVLRSLPGRRLVVRAAGPDGQVVLKLFIGSSREKYLEREFRGLRSLDEAGVPVPAVLARVGGEDVSGLVLNFLTDAEPVDPRDQKGTEQIAALLGKMHEAGVYQRDLHLDNFLVTDGQVYAIDGDGIRRDSKPISRRSGLKNLAVLAAQRAPAQDGGLDGLCKAYLASRGLPSAENLHFPRELDTARRQRARRYLAKAQRDCTEFRVSRTWRKRCFILRGSGEGPVGRISDGGLFDDQEVLKAGNSATVIRVDGEDPFVVKRFNIKNWRHAVRRSIRPIPRFRRAWLWGQLLDFLEIPTARPLALLEEHSGPLKGVAYLVMEDLGDRHLLAEVTEEGLSDERCNEVAQLFHLLKLAGLSHGDTKATNFLVHDGKLHLIDLDSMDFDSSRIEDDLERFLENWQPPEKARFETSFKRAGLL